MKNQLSQISVTLLALAIIAGWFAREAAISIFRTVILGQGADDQMRDLNLNDE